MTENMTDQTPTSTPEHTPDAATPDHAHDDDSKAGRDAARYRRQLRDAETERDALRARLDAAQRREVEHLAQTARVRPVALWASGVTLADLLDAEGNVDAAKVSEAAENAASTLGLSRTPKPDPSQGWHDWSAPGEDDFSSAFGPR